MRKGSMTTTVIAMGAMAWSSTLSAQAATRPVDQATAVIRAVFAAAERADLAALDTLLRR